MYLWKVDDLVEDFKNDRVTQKEQFKYILVFSILSVLSTEPSLYIGLTYSINDTFMSTSALIINIWGVFYIYNKNSNGDNKDFLPRTICIGFPILLRTIAIIIPIYIVLGFIEGYFEPEINLSEVEYETYNTTIGEIIALNIFIIFYFIYLGKKITSVSQKNA